MVILADEWDRKGLVRGVNLHYLTFPYVRRILLNFGNNPSFAYKTYIKADAYVADAFRAYRTMGIRGVKRLDIKFLQHVLATVRSFAPGDIEQIKNQIRAQIQQRLQMKASELANIEKQRRAVEIAARQQQMMTPQINKVQPVSQAAPSVPVAPVVPPTPSPPNNPPGPEPVNR